MSDNACSLVPCPSCPWRSDTAGGPGIPNFDIDKARALANTVGPTDDFRPIMACHGSAEGGESPCRGYLAREGYSNLAVRVAAMNREIPLNQIVFAAEAIDPPLFETFAEMLDNLEEIEARQ